MNQRKIYCLLILFFGIEALFGCIYELTILLNQFNHFIFLIPIGKFKFLFIWLIIVSLSVFAAQALHKNQGWLVNRIHSGIQNKKVISVCKWVILQFVIFAFIGIFFYTAPLFETLKLKGYLFRIQPLLIWLMAVSLECLIVFLMISIRNGGNHKNFHFTPGFKTFISVLAIFFLLWTGVTITGIGIDTNGNSVRAPTVYLSYSQVIIAIILTLEIKMLDILVKSMVSSHHYGKFLRVFNVFLWIMIWTFAVVLWSREPIRWSYNLLGPYPPQNDYLPASDSFRFDFPGQVALIGNGLNNHDYIDNPFYVFFVMILRLLGGQEYTRIIAIQIGVLAITPLVLFEIGKTFNRSGAGILAAFLLILREVNIIHYSADTWMSPVKVLVTEPLMTLLLALMCLFFIKWLQGKPGNPRYLILVGGLLGLSTLVRANSWFLMPTIILIFFFKANSRRKDFFILTFWFCASLLVCIAPWMVRSYLTIDTPFYMWYKYQNSVINERYNVTPTEESQLPFISEKRSNLAVVHAVSLYPNFRNQQVASVSVLKASKQNQLTRYTIYNNLLFTNVSTEFLHSLNIFRKFGDHFFFNFINSIQILPSLLPNDSPTESLVINPTSVFSEWKKASILQKFYGNLTFFLNLVIISAGISSLRKKYGNSSLFLCIFFLVYSAGTTVAYASGSRFTQPIEWVILFFFSSGVVYLSHSPAQILFPAFVDPDEPGKIEMTGNKITRSNDQFHKGNYILPILMFLVIGGSIPLSDIVFPQKYEKITSDDLLNNIDLDRLALFGGNQVNLDEYLANPSTRFFEGQIIYAQYERAGGKRDDRSRTEKLVNFTGIDFLLIGVEKPYLHVTLSLEEPWPETYLNGKTAIVIGCRTEESFDALALIIPEEDLYIIRSSSQAQSCFSKEP